VKDTFPSFVPFSCSSRKTDSFCCRAVNLHLILLTLPPEQWSLFSFPPRVTLSPLALSFPPQSPLSGLFKVDLRFPPLGKQDPFRYKRRPLPFLVGVDPSLTARAPFFLPPHPTRTLPLRRSRRIYCKEVETTSPNGFQSPYLSEALPPYADHQQNFFGFAVVFERSQFRSVFLLLRLLFSRAGREFASSPPPPPPLFSSRKFRRGVAFFSPTRNWRVAHCCGFPF